MRRALTLGLALAALFVSAPAAAIRPFITDDARVVGKGHLQLETYWRRDDLALQHWILPAIGPNDWLELTLGGVHGIGNISTREEGYDIAGPVAQAKVLLRETIPNRPPGFALSAGTVPPLGRGGFSAPGWTGFSYLAMTQAFFKEDDFLIHANIGLSAIAAKGFDPVKFTWGVGTQVETIYDFHLIGEVFSGDPYVAGAGAAYQVGFRIIFNDHLQLDGTYGRGFTGDSPMPPFFSSGFRVVSHELW
ncbi:MAG: transporter [Labilithrix sp.]|nr:transporter [Labilithrix sp.]MCW5813009.1 transporter [Labilithrix sp.]